MEAGVRYLESYSRPPEVIVFVDADCTLDDGALEALVECAWRTERPAQAFYTMTWRHGSDTRAQVVEFAWHVKNWVRPLGLWKLGLPCGLYGSGMAVPRTLLRQMTLASGHLTEDIQLGLGLAGLGRAPVFCPAARVVSHFPDTHEAHRVQRTRWEHGHLTTIGAMGLPLIVRALRRVDLPLLMLALDVCIPPLALLAWLLMLGVAIALMPLSAGLAAPMILFGTLLTALTAATGLAWLRFGQSIIGLRSIAAIPVYVFSKLLFYGAFLFRRQSKWITTARG